MCIRDSGRTEYALHRIRLPGRQSFGAQHQAPRGGIEADRFVRDFQLLKGEAQVFERRGNHPIGDFLGADFKQEGKAPLAAHFLALRLRQLKQCLGFGVQCHVGDIYHGNAHWATSAVGACCWSLQAAAMATAILRTRWITPTRSVTLMAPRASSVLKRLEHLSTWS